MIFLKNNIAELTIDSSFGALPISWKVGGRELLFCPPDYKSFEGKRMCGIPLMYPFANRLCPEVLLVIGREATPINDESVWLRDGQGTLMHGILLWKSGWNIQSVAETSVTYYLNWTDDFWAYKYLPISHRIELIYTLTEGALKIDLRLLNFDELPLPLSYGFHPYFQIDRSMDHLSSIDIPAKKYYHTDEKLIPTGDLNQTSEWFATEKPSVLSDLNLDTCFTDLIQEGNQIVTKLYTPAFDLEVQMDAVYKNLIVYLPKDSGKPYICIEPMIASTNAWHLNAEDLPLVPPGASHASSFTMKVTPKHSNS